MVNFKEEVTGIGGKFIEVSLETATAEAKGGYAQQMDEEFYRRQREAMRLRRVEAQFAGRLNH